MNEKLQITWIDDDSERIKSKKNLESNMVAQVKFVDMKGKNLNAELITQFSTPQPDMIIIDHVLNQLDNSRSGLITKGSTVAELIREKWPTCPIVGVTGATPVLDVDRHKRSIYEGLYPFDDFPKYYKTLKSIAKSFQVLKGRKLKTVMSVLRLLDSPKDDIHRLRSILPAKLKTNYEDKSLPISISRWVRYTLMEKPGFLYDSLWVATLLGIKEKSFEKVKSLFKEAKYYGIFADENNERWWQTKIREALYKKISNEEIKNTRDLGRMLPRINKKDYSLCHACQGDAPEIVGFTDESANTRVQLHLRCSDTHPNFERSLYFEEIRMMKGAE